MADVNGRHGGGVQHGQLAALRHGEGRHGAIRITLLHRVQAGAVGGIRHQRGALHGDGLDGCHLVAVKVHIQIVQANAVTVAGIGTDVKTLVHAYTLSFRNCTAWLNTCFTSGFMGF